MTWSASSRSVLLLLLLLLCPFLLSIAQGSFSQVTAILSTQPCAVLPLSLHQGELHVSKLFHHPSILPYKSVFIAENELWVVAPFMAYGEETRPMARGARGRSQCSPAPVGCAFRVGQRFNLHPFLRRNERVGHCVYYPRCPQSSGVHPPHGIRAPVRRACVVPGHCRRTVDSRDQKTAARVCVPRLTGAARRSVKASHVLISADGQVCVSGLRSIFSLIRHGQRARVVHDFPRYSVKVLPWLSPEVLQQVFRTPAPPRVSRNEGGTSGNVSPLRTSRVTTLAQTFTASELQPASWPTDTCPSRTCQPRR